MPVGVAVTLRGDRGYEFLDRLISIAIPRIRDFRGLNPRSFDGRGNYSMGVKEQIIFPEIDYDAIDQVRGLDITITTSAAPTSRRSRCWQPSGCRSPPRAGPKGYDPEADAASRQAHRWQRRMAAADARPRRPPKPLPVDAPKAAETEAAGRPRAEAEA